MRRAAEKLFTEMAELRAKRDAARREARYSRGGPPSSGGPSSGGPSGRGAEISRKLYIISEEARSQAVRSSPCALRCPSWRR